MQASLAKDSHQSLLAKVSSHLSMRELRGGMRRLWTRWAAACGPHQSDSQGKGMAAALEALDEARGQRRVWQLQPQHLRSLRQRPKHQLPQGKSAAGLAATHGSSTPDPSDARLSKLSDPSTSGAELQHQQHQGPSGKGRLRASLRASVVMPLPPLSPGPSSSAGMASSSYWKAGGAATLAGMGIGSPDLGQCGSVGSMDASVDSIAIRNAGGCALTSVVTEAGLHVRLRSGDSATGSTMLSAEAAGAAAVAAVSDATLAGHEQQQQQQHPEVLAEAVLDNLVRRVGVWAVSRVPKKLKWGKHRRQAEAAVAGQGAQPARWLEPPTDAAMLRPLAQADSGDTGAGGLSNGKFTPFANTHDTWDGEQSSAVASYSAAVSPRFKQGVPVLSVAQSTPQCYSPGSLHGPGPAAGGMANSASGSLTGSGSGSDTRGHVMAAGSVTLPIMPAMAPGMFPDAASSATEQEQAAHALSLPGLGYPASRDVSIRGSTGDGGVPASSVLRDAADVAAAAYATDTGGAVGLSDNPNLAAVVATSLAVDGAGGALNHTPSWSVRLAARAPSLSSSRPASPRSSYAQHDLSGPLSPGPATAAAAATSPLPLGAERPPSAIRKQRTSTLGAGAAAGAPGADRPPSAMRGTLTSTLGAGSMSRAFTAPSIHDAEAEPDVQTHALGADESRAHLAAWPSQHIHSAAVFERSQSREKVWPGGAAHAPSRLGRGSGNGGGTPRGSAAGGLFGPGPLFAPAVAPAAVSAPLPSPSGAFTPVTAVVATGDDADVFLAAVMVVDNGNGSSERVEGRGADALSLDSSIMGRRAAPVPGSARSRAAVRTLPAILSMGGAPEQEHHEMQAEPAPELSGAVTAVRLAASMEEVEEDDDMEEVRHLGL